MLQRIHSRITRDGLLSAGQRVLLAVSGGADSIAMLHAARRLAPRLGVRLCVCHLNHGLRGAAAAQDSAFVEAVCRRMKIPFAGGRADVRRLAARSGLSVEMAAREARYRFFARAAKRLGADVVATAHTADDEAETVLLKLARGAGPRGLAGIPARAVVNGATVVRPMLDVTRAEIVRFLEANRIAWREDASNLDLTFLRNRVRHEILPLIEKTLNPSIRDALRRTASILREEDDWLESMAAAILRDCSVDPGQAQTDALGHAAHGAAFCGAAAPSPRSAPGAARLQCSGGSTGRETRRDAPTLDISRLGRQPLAARRRVLRRWLLEASVPGESVDFGAIERIGGLMQQGRTGRMLELAGGWQVRRGYGRLTVRRSDAAPRHGGRTPLNVPGVTLLPSWGLRVLTRFAPGIAKPAGVSVGQWPARASIRCSAIRRNRIYVRARRTGDRMRPFGLSGSKKVQDIFVDAKVPVDQRAGVPLLECGGEIIWIPGYRIARGWEVKDPAARILQITISMY